MAVKVLVLGNHGGVSKTRTVIEYDEDTPFSSLYLSITNVGGVLDHHFAPDTEPVWIAGDDHNVVSFLASALQIPEVRELESDSL